MIGLCGRLPFPLRHFRQVVVRNRSEAHLGRYLKVPLESLGRKKVLVALALLRLPACTVAHGDGYFHLTPVPF
jgi:hypothetical protein